jgi:Mrp family chromosome partitioning ATPase
VSTIQSRMRRETLKIVDGLQGQAKIAAARATALKKSLENLKSRESEAALDEVKLKELEREAKANRDQLELMLTRFADSNTRQNLELQPATARIIQTASAPSAPYFPRIGPIMLLTCVAGLAMGLGLAFLLEIMAQASRMANMNVPPPAPAPTRGRQTQHHFHEPDFDIPDFDAPRYPRQPAYTNAASPYHMAAQATAPSNVSALPLIVASVPQARSGLEARSLLNNLTTGGSHENAMLQILQHIESLRGQSQLKAMTIAGVGGQNEVPALSLALARSLSHLGYKTILVDLDAQRSPLPDLIELPYAPGLTELVAGATEFNKTVQRDAQSKLQFMRFGNGGPQSATQVAARMESVTQTLCGIYDFVILHAGEATPSLLQQAKGSKAVFLNTPVARKKDAIAAANTLKAKGFENVVLIQVEGIQQAAA